MHVSSITRFTFFTNYMNVAFLLSRLLSMLDNKIVGDLFQLLKERFFFFNLQTKQK